MSYTENFQASVQAVIAPRLHNIGFRQQARLIFMRPIGRFQQVIEFAPSRSDDERFTVRLGIYLPFAPGPDGEEPDPLDAPGVSRCHVRVSLGKILYGKEFIWKTSLAWDEAYRQMRDALRGILIHGLGWLAQSSEPAALVRFFARQVARQAEQHRSHSLPPTVLLGLLYEATGEAAQARRWYRRAVQRQGEAGLGLRAWIFNRLHNLPAD